MLSNVYDWLHISKSADELMKLDEFSILLTKLQQYF